MISILIKMILKLLFMLDFLLGIKDTKILKHEVFIKEISEELMPVALHSTRW